MAMQAVEDQKERKIEVNRAKLIEILKSNRDKHGKDYLEAVDGYKEMAINKLQEAHEEAKKTLEKNVVKGLESLNDFDAANPKKGSDYLTLVNAIHVELKVPRNFTDKYDAAIDMAVWDVRETLELTQAEFQCFVRDIWEWSEDFRVTNTMYANKIGKMK